MRPSRRRRGQPRPARAARLLQVAGDPPTAQRDPAAEAAAVPRPSLRPVRFRFGSEGRGGVAACRRRLAHVSSVSAGSSLRSPCRPPSSRHHQASPGGDGGAEAQARLSVSPGTSGMFSRPPMAGRETPPPTRRRRRPARQPDSLPLAVRRCGGGGGRCPDGHPATVFSGRRPAPPDSLSRAGLCSGHHPARPSSSVRALRICSTAAAGNWFQQMRVSNAEPARQNIQHLLPMIEPTFLQILCPLANL